MHTFNYDPSKIVDEHASSETVTQVAIDLLNYLEVVSGTGTRDLVMLFAYDLGGIVIQEVVPPSDKYYHNLANYERQSLLRLAENTAKFLSGHA